MALIGDDAVIELMRCRLLICEADNKLLIGVHRISCRLGPPASFNAIANSLAARSPRVTRPSAPDGLRYCRGSLGCSISERPYYLSHRPIDVNPLRNQPRSAVQLQVVEHRRDVREFRAPYTGGSTP